MQNRTSAKKGPPTVYKSFIKLLSTTNTDGRNSEPILTTDELAELGNGLDSVYKLRFHAAKYFNSENLFFPMPELAFKVIFFLINPVNYAFQCHFWTLRC